MDVYQVTALTKKRINQKSWDLGSVAYFRELPVIQDTDKSKCIVYRFLNAESVEQVRDFNANHSLIVMSPMGMQPSARALDMTVLLADAVKATTCSVTGKKVVVAHYCRD